MSTAGGGQSAYLAKLPTGYLRSVPQSVENTFKSLGPSMNKTTEQLRAELAAAEAADRKQDDERRKAQSIAWEQITNNPDAWEWSVQPVEDKEWITKVVRHGARVSKRLKPEILAEWKKGGFSTFSANMQDGCWHGMFYYRTEENILTRRGGGTLVLNDPMLCNDEEWAAIVAGNIPLKYRR